MGRGEVFQRIYKRKNRERGRGAARDWKRSADAEAESELRIRADILIDKLGGDIEELEDPEDRERLAATFKELEEEPLHDLIAQVDALDAVEHEVRETKLAKMAKDLLRVLGAFPDPRGITTTEQESLAALRTEITEAATASPLVREDLDAGFNAVEELHNQVKKVREAAAKRKEEADAAEQLAEEKRGKLLDLLNTQASDAQRYKKDCEARVRDGIAEWTDVLNIDGQDVDPAVETAVHDARDAVLVALENWRSEQSAVRDQVYDELDDIDEVQVNALAESAEKEIGAKQTILADQLERVKKLTRDLQTEQAARLTNIDELRLTNRFSGKSPRQNDVRACLLENRQALPNGMLQNAMDYVQGLRSGASDVQKATASKQKPNVVIKNYLTATDATLVPIYDNAMALSANELLPKGLKNVADLVRELRAINEADRNTNRWLVRMFLQGAEVSTLRQFHTAKAQLEGVPINGEYAQLLNRKMSDPTFDIAVFSRLKAQHGANSAFLFPAAVKTYLKTDSEDLGGKVARDDYGLYGANKPGNAEEPKMAQGLSDGVVSMNQRRTTSSPIHGPGYAYLFSYAHASSPAMYELHVHVKPGTNYHPAWKRCSSPKEYVPGRDVYNIAPALKAKL